MPTTKKPNTTKTAKKKPAAKAQAKPKPTADGKEQKMSALDAAANVLNEKGVAMTCPELIGVMAGKGYWSSPNGKTPAATLNAALLREIATKGTASRFIKTAPGRFAAAGAPVVTPAKATPAKKAKPAAKKKPKPKPTASEVVTNPPGESSSPTIPDGTPGPESMAELFRV